VESETRWREEDLGWRGRGPVALLSSPFLSTLCFAVLHGDGGISFPDPDPDRMGVAESGSDCVPYTFAVGFVR
jgi:hypothetical protein